MLVLGACMLASTGCMRLKQTGAAAAPPTKFMDPGDATKILDVKETDQPSGYFVVDGKPFCFAGTNNYYLTFKSKPMVDDVLESAKAMKLRVVRFWGYLDIGSIDNSVPSVDGGPKDHVYFQYWDKATQRPMRNEDPKTGLGRLDYVLAKSRELGLKVIVVLTNNWRAFGGMDQYLTWYGLSKHHEFYTNAVVKAAYKDWAAALVNRKNTINGVMYRDDPTIFAWELANEPRCIGDAPFNAQGWTGDTITQWADEMSAYVKSIDPNHMVAVGDEGFLTSGGHWTYKGQDGVQHEDLVALKNIDFGTFHLYPDHWGAGLRYGNQWVEDHIKVARKFGKPTIMEEYGILVRRDAKGEINWGWDRRKAAYSNWNELMLKKGGAGSLSWMLGGIDDEHGKYKDYDGFIMYRDDKTSRLIQPYVNRFFNDAQACRQTTVSDQPVSPFVRPYFPGKKR